MFDLYGNLFWKLSQAELKGSIKQRFHLLSSNTLLVCQSEHCQESFDLIHIDQCNSGCVTIKRHDYVKTIIARFGEHAYVRNSINVEPKLRELMREECKIINGNLSDKARFDVLIKDFQEIHKNSFSDI